MEDKKAYEAFRVRQFSGPHPARQTPANPPDDSDETAKLTDATALLGTPIGIAAADPLRANLVPDHDRVILHFDVDCFYAQGNLSCQQAAGACRQPPHCSSTSTCGSIRDSKQPELVCAAVQSTELCTRGTVALYVRGAVEECRNPSLRGQPLAVTQKYLVVTANYPARAAGVTK